jgi:primase-polymerase (primpol)-like protein
MTEENTPCHMNELRSDLGNIMTDSIVLFSLLMQHDQFVNYAIKERNGKLTKPPVSPDGKPINSQDATNWLSFNDALAVSNQIGFVLTSDDPFLFIDLDHVLQDGKLCGWAEELLTELSTTYAEISPSGDGLHLYYSLNDKPVIPRHKKNFDDGTALEIYFDGRYFTITGDVYINSPIATVSSFEL